MMTGSLLIYHQTEYADFPLAQSVIFVRKLFTYLVMDSHAHCLHFAKGLNCHIYVWRLPKTGPIILKVKFV